MKVVIKGRPEELRARGGDLRRVVEELLRKAGVEDQIDQSPRPLDYPALQGAVDRASRNVDRARRVMLRRFAKVLNEGA